MIIHAEKTPDNKSKGTANNLPVLDGNIQTSIQLQDMNPEAIARPKLQEMVNNSPQAKQRKSFVEMVRNSPQAKQAAQLRGMVNNLSGQAGSAVVQRAIEKGRLNVAGEDHNESYDRREEEAAFSADQAGGAYWTEETFPVTITTPEGEVGEVSADPVLLQWFNGLHFAAVLTEDLRLHCIDLDDPGSGWTLVAFKAQTNKTSAVILNTADAFDRLVAKGAKDKRLINEQSNISTIEKIIAQAAIIELIRKTEMGIRGKAILAVKATAAADPSTHQAIVKERFKIAEELELMANAITALQLAADYKFGGRQLSYIRSMNMAEAADKKVATKGVWKIGTQHVTDIQEGWQPTFNLVSEGEFNELLAAWKKPKAPEVSFEEARWAHYSKEKNS